VPFRITEIEQIPLVNETDAQEQGSKTDETENPVSLA
jgi:hypothetical protein